MDSDLKKLNSLAPLELTYAAILCTYIHNIGHKKLDRHFQCKLFSDQIL